MPQLQADTQTPYYEQLREFLLQEIHSGVYGPGDKIPSENQLCARYDVSRVTVGKALQGLVDEGVLIKRHGKGAFVASIPVVEQRSEQRSFTASCLQMGRRPGTHLISRKMQKGKKELARLLCREADDLILCIKRVRCVDEVPVIFEMDYFSADAGYLLTADVESTPLLKTVELNRSLTLLHFSETFDVQFATREQARSLNCPVNTPLLGVRQIVTDDQGVVYVNDQFIRSDIYKYVTES